MHIMKAEIVGFGAYRQREFTFSAGNQLIYGENEAGKSTLYQFIQAMLFGFPKKSNKKRDYTPTDGAAYGGRLWIATPQYKSIKIERFRQANRGKARVWLGELETTEEHLQTVLGGLTLAMFQEIYTFQQEQLSKLDHLQEDELHQALLSIGISGNQSIMSSIQADKKNNQALFRPRGQRLPLNQLIQQYKQLQARIQVKEQQEAQVQAKVQRVGQIQHEMEQMNQTSTALHEHAQQYEQQTLHWSLYEEWQMLRQTLPKEENLATPELTRRVQHFYQRYQDVTATIQKHQAEIARLEQGNTSERYFFYLEHEATIQQVSKAQVELARMVDQVAQQTSTLQVKLQQQQKLEAKWGWQADQPPALAQQAIYDQLAMIKKLQQERQLLHERKRWVAEQQVATEEKQMSEIDHYQVKKDYAKPLRIVAIVALVLGGITVLIRELGPSIFFMLLGISSGIMSYRLSSSKNTQSVHESSSETPKRQTNYELELQDLSDQLLGKQEAYEKLVHQLYPFFGEQVPVDEWPFIVQHYDEEVQIYLDLLQSLPPLRQSINTIQTKLAEKEQIWADFGEWLPLAKLPLMEQVTKILAFGEEMQAIKMERLQQPSTLLAKQVQQLQLEREQLIKTHDALLHQLGIEQPTDIPMWMRQWEEHWQRRKRERELAQMLAGIYPQQIKKDELATLVQKNHQQQMDLKHQKELLVAEQQKLRLELAQLQEDGTLDELYQQRVLLEDDLQESTTQWASNQLHAAMLGDLATNRSEQQLPQLVQKAVHFFQILTRNHYQKIWFDEGLLFVANEKQTFDIYQLSTGTKDQLIMAIRFAYLSLQGNETLCPIMIDDGWLHYDYQRKYDLAQLFKEFGKTMQVICLSSDREMVSYYQELDQMRMSIE